MVLGAHPVARAVQSFSWDELPNDLNIADYDVVIMDLVPLILDVNLAAQVNRRALPSASQVMRLLRGSDSGVLILSGGTPEQYLWQQESAGGGSYYPLGQLFPFLPHFTKESGEQIQVVDESFDWYLDRVDHWFWWAEVNHFNQVNHLITEYLKEAGPGATALYPNVDIIASARFGKPIAFRLDYVATSSANAALSVRDGRSNEIVTTFGPLYWLPRMTEAPTDSVDLILERMLGISGPEQAPAWSERYRLPREAAALNRLESVEAEMQELEKQIGLAKQRLSDEQRFKKLLYAQGSDPVLPGSFATRS